MTQPTFGEEEKSFASFIVNGLKQYEDIGFLRITKDSALAEEDIAKIILPENAETASHPVKLPYQPARITTSDGRYDFEISPRRLIYPGQIEFKPKDNSKKELIDFVRKELGIFYSNGLLTKIRYTPSLIEKIKSSENRQPSMLLRVQFMDRARLSAHPISKEPYFMATLPVLLIPGATEDGEVQDFCEDNSVYSMGHKYPGEEISQTSHILSPKITKEQYRQAVSNFKEQYPIELCQA